MLQQIQKYSKYGNMVDKLKEEPSFTLTWPPRYNWNIVESDVIKHHSPDLDPEIDHSWYFAQLHSENIRNGEKCTYDIIVYGVHQ